ncbi:hypothetical protein QZH41_017049, partial [Actinostola sp. cb2023]
EMVVTNVVRWGTLPGNVQTVLVRDRQDNDRNKRYGDGGQQSGSRYNNGPSFNREKTPFANNNVPNSNPGFHGNQSDGQNNFMSMLGRGETRHSSEPQRPGQGSQSTYYPPLAPLRKDDSQPMQNGYQNQGQNQGYQEQRTNQGYQNPPARQSGSYQQEQSFHEQAPSHEYQQPQATQPGHQEQSSIQGYQQQVGFQQPPQNQVHQQTPGPQAYQEQPPNQGYQYSPSMPQQQQQYQEQPPNQVYQQQTPQTDSPSMPQQQQQYQEQPPNQAQTPQTEYYKQPSYQEQPPQPAYQEQPPTQSHQSEPNQGYPTTSTPQATSWGERVSSSAVNGSATVQEQSSWQARSHDDNSRSSGGRDQISYNMYMYDMTDCVIIAKNLDTFLGNVQTQANKEVKHAIDVVKLGTLPGNVQIVQEAKLATNAVKLVTLPENALTSLGLEITSYVTDVEKQGILPEIAVSHLIEEMVVTNVVRWGTLPGNVQTLLVAYLLPTLTNIINKGLPSASRSPLVLCLAPTRELVIQIYKEARKFSDGTPIKVAVVYGGVSVAYQAQNLEQGCHFLAATPGRLQDFISRERVYLDNIKYLILDEADRMLDMGFEPAIRKIVEQSNMTEREHRQTLMFSATFPDEIQRLAGDFLRKDYLFLAVGRVGGTNLDIQQHVLQVNGNDKRDKLFDILNESGRDRTLVFVELKRVADFLACLLSENSFPTTSISSDRSQREREEALRDFRNGRAYVLVATSVAARGLDIPDVKHVVNYDMPQEIDEYVHRIGRTGRIGNQGKATSFYEQGRDEKLARSLVKVLSEACQDVPTWLEQAAEDAVGSSYGPKGGRFSARDHRERGGGRGRPDQSSPMSNFNMQSDPNSQFGSQAPVSNNSGVQNGPTTPVAPQAGGGAAGNSDDDWD